MDTNGLLDQLTKEKIIARRKLLQQNAPIIYQLFVAKKRYKSPIEASPQGSPTTAGQINKSGVVAEVTQVDGKKGLPHEVISGGSDIRPSLG
jgi:hypothetical protein